MVLVEQADDFLVDLAAEHHLDHVHRAAVGYAQAVDETRFDIQLLEQFSYLRAAAMDDDRMNADQFHEHDVGRETLLERFVDHGVAAVFDHHRIARELPNVRKRLGQNPGDGACPVYAQ